MLADSAEPVRWDIHHRRRALQDVSFAELWCRLEVCERMKAFFLVVRQSPILRLLIETAIRSQIWTGSDTAGQSGTYCKHANQVHQSCSKQIPSVRRQFFPTPLDIGALLTRKTTDGEHKIRKTVTLLLRLRGAPSTDQDIVERHAGFAGYRIPASRRCTQSTCKHPCTRKTTRCRSGSDNCRAGRLNGHLPAFVALPVFALT